MRVFLVISLCNEMSNAGSPTRTCLIGVYVFKQDGLIKYLSIWWTLFATIRRFDAVPNQVNRFSREILRESVLCCLHTRFQNFQFCIGLPVPAAQSQILLLLFTKIQLYLRIHGFPCPWVGKCRKIQNGFVVFTVAIVFLN